MSKIYLISVAGTYSFNGNEMGSNVLLYFDLDFSNLKHHVLMIISVPKAERLDHVKDFGTYSRL